MKLVIYALGLMSVLVAAATTTMKANAQMRVDVPFSFNIGSVRYPAGLYLIQTIQLNQFVMLEDQDRHEIEGWNLRPGDLDPADTRIGLIFDEVESGHILRAVQYRALTTARLDGYKQSSQQAKLRFREEK